MWKLTEEKAIHVGDLCKGLSGHSALSEFKTPLDKIQNMKREKLQTIVEEMVILKPLNAVQALEIVIM